jgi:hypothetical protein
MGECRLSLRILLPQASLNFARRTSCLLAGIGTSGLCSSWGYQGSSRKEVLDRSIGCVTRLHCRQNRSVVPKYVSEGRLKIMFILPRYKVSSAISYSPCSPR